MKAPAKIQLVLSIVACLMSGTGFASTLTAAEPAGSAAAGSVEPAAHFESCLNAAQCTFLYGTHKVTVVLADVDAPKLEGRCSSEIVTARHARDEVIVMLQSAESIILELSGTPDSAGIVTGHVIADGTDVGHLLMKRGLAGSKASWMRKHWC